MLKIFSIFFPVKEHFIIDSSSRLENYSGYLDDILSFASLGAVVRFTKSNSGEDIKEIALNLIQEDYKILSRNLH